MPLYIAADDPTAAHKVISCIYEKIQLLRSHPRLGQRYEPITDREIRETLYGHYRIAYLLPSEERVEIYRRYVALAKDDPGSEIIDKLPVVDEFGQWIPGDWPRILR